MKSIWKILIVIIIVILIVLSALYIIDTHRMKNNKNVLFSTWGRNYSVQEEQQNIENVNYNTENINIVLSLEDKITDNTAWCGTFNLIWNDLKNDLVKQDIVFTPQLDSVKNLNKETFNTTYLSQDSYYKVYGRPSLELKAQIEKEIKEKFNETSDILDNFEWEDTEATWFLYAMLKKQFEYPVEFAQLPNGKFGKYEDVQYFGTNELTGDKVNNQVKVLYYNSKEDFAIKLLTKTNDEVIISKGNKEDTFLDIYKQIEQNANNFKGNKYFTSTDKLKIPNVSFKLKNDIVELANKVFENYYGDNCYIKKAMQTIQFDLDKNGGKIKSEAGIMYVDQAYTINPNEPREFLVDNTFTMFLKENGKELPYFATKISNIKNVQ